MWSMKLEPRLIPTRAPAHPKGWSSSCMAGRLVAAACGSARPDQPDVSSVVALNPWVYPTDRSDLRGRRVLFVHGTADRVADASRSAVVARALSHTTEVSYIRVPGGKHAMLHHHRTFDRFAAEFATGTLLDTPHHGPVGRALAGEAWIDATRERNG
jgi:pimeloyl-ACP methyl ester carboxylesterase